MDKPLPDDFDPTQLVDYPMQTPGERDNERNQDGKAPKDAGGNEEVLFPPLHMLPRSLRKLLLTGSCCAGVALLYALSAVDHGLMPGVDSSFAKASEVKGLKDDMNDIVVMQLGSAIRDLSADNCIAQSRALDDQIIALRLKYKARTGAEYPHTECKKP